MKHIFIISFLLACAVCVYGQSGKPDVYPGKLVVKLSADDEKKVQGARMLKASAGSMLKLGIARLDAMNSRYSVTEMRRVFPDAGAYEAKHRKYGLHLWYTLDISKDVDPQAVASAYAAGGLVEQAEPVYKPKRIKPLSDSEELATTVLQGMQRNATMNDPWLYLQWSYNNDGTTVSSNVPGVDIRLFDAWNIATGTPNVIVSVVDGGIAYAHEDLAANMWVNQAEVSGTAGFDDDSNGYADDIYGYNFVDNTGTITADSHGTHVSGTVAAVNNNTKGVAGVAGGDGSIGSGVRLMSCQIFDGNSSAESAAPAIVYGADNGAVISQNSWGFDAPDVYPQSTKDAIRYFIEQAGRDENGNPRPNTPMVGGIVIFAAGNDGDSQNWYPAAADEVLAVAGIGPAGKKGLYSNYGSWVDISAPGGESGIQKGIYSTTASLINMYGYNYGTSMACPHVSGVAALVLSKYGSATYTPDSLRNRLLLTTTPLGTWESIYVSRMGAGLLNASAALRMVPVRSISLNITSAKMFENQRLQLAATILPANATDKKVIWTSSNTDCATVDANGNVLTISAGAENPATVVITARTEDGSYEATCTIQVYRDVVVPEGFSPNNDGFNDYLAIQPYIASETYSLNVVDRSGQQCYQNTDYKNNWNGIANTGYSKGKKILPGTYYYTLFLKSTGIKKRGAVVVRY